MQNKEENLVRRRW